MKNTQLYPLIILVLSNSLTLTAADAQNYIRDIPINKFLIAANEGDKKTLVAMVNDGMSVDTRNHGVSALGYAIDGNQLDIVSFLLEQQASVTDVWPNNVTPVTAAVNEIYKNGRSYEILYLLLRYHPLKHALKYVEKPSWWNSHLTRILNKAIEDVEKRESEKSINSNE